MSSDQKTETVFCQNERFGAPSETGTGSTAFFDLRMPMPSVSMTGTASAGVRMQNMPAKRTLVSGDQSKRASRCTHRCPIATCLRPGLLCQAATAQCCR